MQRYYCEHCRTLYNQIGLCTKCGTLAEKQIRIEVHAQPDSNNV